MSRITDFFREKENGHYAAYDNTRLLKNKKYLCHAPFNNMYFNIHGQAGPCWLTLGEADNIKDKSIRDIWRGEKFQRIREAIRRRDLSYACGTCEANIKSGNYISALAKLYDLDYPLSDYPVEMEFELSNICNLECVMCKGDLSSVIREKREKLPPVQSPYDDSFVEQLKEFIPYLKEAKFLGGEPFLIPIYYKIWDAIIAINPSVKITVTTNGTVWNKRVQGILQALHFNVIMSIDSFFKDTYDAIRIGSNYGRVMENFEHFRSYAAARNAYMGVSVNPLRKNWRELNKYVDLCIEKNVSLWFNTIVYPHKEALWTLSAEQLEEVYDELSSKKLLPQPARCANEVYSTNVNNYRNLVEVQISNWRNQARQNEAARKEELRALTFSELTHKWKERLLYFIHTDAYLPEVEKQAKIITVQNALDAVQEATLRDWYAKPETEVIERMENGALTPNNAE